MKEQEVKLVIGGLLHDIGKVIFREGTDGRNHSKSGYDYLKEEVKIKEKEILDCVRFHHGSLLKNALIPEESLAYIVYIADNIAAAVDRRKTEEQEPGFDRSMPLQSIFNLLNGNDERKYFRPGDLDPDMEINYPQDEKISFTEEMYKKIKRRITDNLKGMEWTDEYINSLLAVMEANLSYIPSSTARGEVADISLFDHIKLTAAFASCILEYLKKNDIKNYKEYLFINASRFYDEQAFLLCTLDFSGIQNFIYTITSKNALKTLRARSFYLEIMMEHIMDSLLQPLNLSRANILYSGGGHAYLLLPNTSETKQCVDEYLQQVNHWLMEKFRISLYLAGAFAPCSCNDLKNIPEGSYSKIFSDAGAAISKQKMHRYTAKDIVYLNQRKEEDYSRECKVCKNIAKTDEEGVCPLCRTIEKISKDILYGDFFTVVAEEIPDGLPLPGNCTLVSDSEQSLKERMKTESYVRTYGKNKMYTGRHLASKIWTADYTTGQSFEEFAEASEGIQRVGILRADVDNLGTAIVSGFDNEKNHNRYVTLSRTAALSRHLSLFFKFYIRRILTSGIYSIDGQAGRRNATIVYSGGDDVFIVGSWKDIIELAVDLRRSFQTYTQGTLSISAGIGIYESGYPVSAIARETGSMEDESKKLPGKNAVTLLEDGTSHLADGEEISDGTWKWEEFEKEVLGEKYRELESFLSDSEERGTAFLYHLLELIRNRKEKINFARTVYLLSRLEPVEEGEKKQRYQRFAEKIYQWIQTEKDARQLKTAITLYVYRNRGGSERAD